jgi:hypothetical protein
MKMRQIVFGAAICAGSFLLGYGIDHAQKNAISVPPQIELLDDGGLSLGQAHPEVSVGVYSSFRPEAPEQMLFLKSKGREYVLMMKGRRHTLYKATPSGLDTVKLREIAAIETDRL